ncbi:MAG TPA: tetratricopeptide repeat protein [Candidatus Sulfopaludibacter sp.]|nr:tetratricopeptide repeat protein [Candidatus Sulfopaludibacter sp.]
MAVFASAGTTTLITAALATGRRVLGSKHPVVAAFLSSLAKLRLAQARYPDAESHLREALSLGGEAPNGDWDPCESQSLLGLSLMQQSKFVEAEPLLLYGYRGLLQRKAIPQTEKAGERIIQLYTSWGKPDKVAEWRHNLQPEK